MRMKKCLSILLAVVMLATMIAVALPVSATSNTWDPDHGVYNITTEEDLFAFNEGFWTQGMYYEGIEINLLADITITEGKVWTSAPSNDGVESMFAGTFNGNNHTISNLNMVSSDNSTVSFLPLLYNATIKDLTLKDVTIENGYTWNAAFACISYANDTISNCHLKGDCTIKPYDDMPDSKSNFNGGIVGSKYSGTLRIENCSVGDADSSVKINKANRSTSKTASHSGGILGFVRKTASVEIVSTDNYADVGCDTFAAGIIGTVNGFPNAISKAKIIGCHNYGNISSSEANNSGLSLCAGIVGYESPDSILVIDQCSNHGNITLNCNSSAYASGGLAGELRCAAVLNSYNTGKITAKSEITAIGGVVGHIRVNGDFTMHDTSFFDYYPTDYFNAIINCYNVGNVTADQTHYVGGVCGYVQDYYSVEPRSVVKNAYNFAQVSGLYPVGTAVGCVQDTMIQDVYGQTGTHALDSIEFNSQNTGGVETCISAVGYFDTPDVTGTIYPATVKAKGLREDSIVETISATPLSGNLLSLLNKKVDEYNAELAASGSEYRYLTWKMTNPASEDGSKGVDVHPMFGIQDFVINFYANFNDNEEPFRTYTVENLVTGKVPVFYDLPEHDGYIFKGWYLDKGNNDDESPISFDTVYSSSTDIYAHWIKVEDVAKVAEDTHILPGGGNTYGGFDLMGVQIRKERTIDPNYGYEHMPGGMRFITSLSKKVVNEINALDDKTDIEYGFVTTTDTNQGWIDYHDHFGRKLQYVSKTANGINTLDPEGNDTYFDFARNINCTSKQSSSAGVVNWDHCNYNDYLLYTLVVTYEEEGADKGKYVLARPYIHYKDANGLERVAYSDYNGNSKKLGGCYTNYERLKEQEAKA